MTKQRIALFALACFALAGCSPRTKNVTNLPAGVTQAQALQWDNEVAALHKMATITSSMRQAVIALEQAGAWPDSVAYVKALQTVAKIDQFEIVATNYLRDQPSYFNQPTKDKLVAILSNVAVQLASLNGESLAGIKDANTKKEITLLVTDFTATMNLAISIAK